MKYQRDYSQCFPAVTDQTTRARKALKVVRILESHLGHDLSGLLVLDLGCSIGIVADRLAQSAHLAIGIDIDGKAIGQAVGRNEARAIYAIADFSTTPFADETFDVIICSQVYEHAPSLEMLVAEIRRLLNKDGVCFFSGPNRWAVIEPHYRLPFLSWLPRSLADRYVQVMGRAQEYYEHPRSAGELRRTLSGFTVHDCTSQLLGNPAYFSSDDELGVLRRLAPHIPAWIWRLVGRWVPNFNWVLTKRG